MDEDELVAHRYGKYRSLGTFALITDEKEREAAIQEVRKFMDPLFLIIIDIFLYSCFFGWPVWKRLEYRFCDTLSL
jgi:hypothetical protein